MKILVVTQYFWPENFRINDLVLGLKERGHEVTVLTGIPNYPEGRFYPGYGFFFPCREEFKGIPVLRVPLVPRGCGKGVRLALNYFSFAVFACLLAPLRCRGDFDAIFVYEPSPITVGLPALVLKKTKRAPLLFWVQDLWPESLSATAAVHSPHILHWVGKLVRYIYRRCDRVLVQSRGFIAPVLAAGVAPSRVHYFPNFAEDFYRPVTLQNDAPERVGMPNGFCVMFAGNIGEAQDFGTILAAAEKLKGYPDIHWLILGDGRKLSWVKNQIERRELDGTVHLLGKHPVETMPLYFSLADAMLVALKNEPVFSLTIPSKLQSYLACGKPIIAALGGEGARIVLEAGAGLTPVPEDARALADAVLTMYQMPDDARRAMGLKGRSYFESNFERALLLERLDRWLTEVKGASVACAF